tara:strand:- start:49 stop:474 length:426 start_codon:yes stop_codon:yes gene_type:complete
MHSFKSTTTTFRIEVVDALRGFALLGVLFANIPCGRDPPVAGIFDESLPFLLDLLISKKFITLFSILFGFGFYIQMSRTEKTGINFRKYFVKRMSLLFLIGTIHCLFLGWGYYHILCLWRALSTFYKELVYIKTSDSCSYF